MDGQASPEMRMQLKDRKSMRPTGQNCVPVSLNILIINLRSTSTLISILQELTAMEKGQAAFETFVKSRLTKEKTMSIFNPTKKMKLSSFSSMNKTKTCKVYPKIIPVQASKEIFAKISLVAQIRSLNIRSVFKFSLGPLSWALAEPMGTLKKISKAMLLHKLEGPVEPLGKSKW